MKLPPFSVSALTAGPCPHQIPSTQRLSDFRVQVFEVPSSGCMIASILFDQLNIVAQSSPKSCHASASSIDAIFECKGTWHFAVQLPLLATFEEAKRKRSSELATENKFLAERYFYKKLNILYTNRCKRSCAVVEGNRIETVEKARAASFLTAEVLVQLLLFVFLLFWSTDAGLRYSQTSFSKESETLCI